ncbi:DUF4124 domain-containing protein [Oleiagrimonas sp. C23AA]|uniref:DUF4124 domain-containing protein n=1 Tax=Oleiagrimonas sp. C23AA TaxID=2719047 RepID=UPI001421564A|nr:DUF4124 domain-containing protein [Oleiagrimonas sp. C23AA]NII09166.1 DUF4124 domain-containing protein [Oleiagrimonas sp. C23AA]
MRGPRQWRASAMVALVLAAVCGSASGQQTVYQWKDAAGTTHFSAAPPPHGSSRKITLQDGQVEHENAAKPMPATKPPPRPTSELYKVEAEYRQQSCKAARDNLALLESGNTVLQRAPGNRQRRLDAASREQAKAQAKANIDKFCLDARPGK